MVKGRIKDRGKVEKTVAEQIKRGLATLWIIGPMTMIKRRKRTRRRGKNINKGKKKKEFIYKPVRKRLLMR